MRGMVADDFCGARRPAKVTAVQCAELTVLESRRQRVRLFKPYCRKRTIQLPLIAPFDVPRRFTVAHHDHAGVCHRTVLIARGGDKNAQELSPWDQPALQHHQSRWCSVPAANSNPEYDPCVPGRMLRR